MKNIPIFKIPVVIENLELNSEMINPGHLLFNLDKDPKQENPIRSDQIENDMIKKLVSILNDFEAPPEIYERLSL